MNKFNQITIYKIIFISCRCFPQCCQSKGHRDSGFCGRSLEALIIITKPKQGIFEPSKLYVIQDIHVSDETKLRMSERVTRSELQGIVKGENDSPGQYSYWQGKLRNVLESETRLEINASFNSRLRSWDYDWNSNRWRGEKLHVVQVYVLFEVEPNILEVIGTVVGPDFQITSNKTQSMRNKLDRAMQDASSSGGANNELTTSSSTHFSVHDTPLKRAKPMVAQQALTGHSAESMHNIATSSNPYLEYLNAASACLRGHIEMRTSSGQDAHILTSTGNNTTSGTSPSAESAFSLLANPAHTGSSTAGYPTIPNLGAINNLGPISLPRLERSNVNTQAKILRDAMSLEDVSHVLMSLKSSSSGQMYSTANLINPSAYMFDVNRLIELQRVPLAQSPSANKSGDIKPATGVHNDNKDDDNQPINIMSTTHDDADNATNDISIVESSLQIVSSE